MTVVVEQDRYDELLHKEATLEAIVKFHERTSGFSFHDVVGYLLQEKPQGCEPVRASRTCNK